MKTQSSKAAPFLTERERLIAEQVRKLKDLQPYGAVIGGASKTVPSTKPSDIHCHIHPN